MKRTVQTRGVCARGIEYEIDADGLVRNVRFLGGCAGNAIGLANMVDGMTPAEVVKRLKGVPCQMRGTSCPDQLAKALEEEGK
ncbi:MAG: TIGR03905 family TSCPD domain-containing protein [Firmicutes bacterium]|nr:TIGR03905 family TSCPD domain-containing protein [Bacillota bacterium]